MSTKMTPWFHGNVDKPVRPGVYMQMSGGWGDKRMGYQYWDGVWYSWDDTIGGAVDFYRSGRRAVLSHQNDDWRGVLK